MTNMPIVPLRCVSTARTLPASPAEGTRGRAVATVAVMRGVQMLSVDRDDPLVAYLADLPAYALDYVRVHYRESLHGAPSVTAVHAILERLLKDLLAI